MADDRTYIKVHDGIEDHPKTAALSDKGFRLLLTTWAWCSRHHTDGRVPLPVWKKRGTAKARGELIAAGLVEVYDDHVVMHDYLEHQRSAAKIEEIKEARREGGRWGSHKRWHVAEKKRDPECEYCTGAQPPPKGSGPNGSTHSKPSDSPNGAPYGPGYPETETETEKRTKRLPEAAPVGDARARGGRGASGPHAAAAAKLVRRVLGRDLTSGTLTLLTIEVATLAAEVDEPTLVEALERWNSRTEIGPKLLGALVDDIRKERRGATSRRTAAAPPASATDAFAAQFLGVNQPPPPPLRALPGGA